jgi:predicted dehydrogenase
MDKVRLGVIGLGNIGRFHASCLLEGNVGRAELTAVCSRRPQPLPDHPAVRVFPEPASLLASGLVDAVVIATPHPQHTAEGIAAFQAGVHVMMEKPIAAHKADAERLIAAHRQHPQLVFAAMFQFRTEPHYRKIRELIQQGDLGRIVRVNWINTDWFRTDAYYASSPWRATWQGEGGGVLINQCLHNLDMLQWLCGMPKRLRGFCRFGRYHPIEVEDDATAWIEWADGASGVFIGSTGEAPGTNRLEITGTHGRLVLEQGRLTLDRNEIDMTEFCRTTQDGFGKPAAQSVEIPCQSATDPHAAVLQNFVDAILDGTPLLAPGAEGLHSLELANAIVFSSLLDRPLDLPLDGAAWQQRLQELIAQSTHTKRVVPGPTADITRSFRS